MSKIVSFPCWERVVIGILGIKVLTCIENKRVKMSVVPFWIKTTNKTVWIKSIVCIWIKNLNGDKVVGCQGWFAIATRRSLLLASLVWIKNNTVKSNKCYTKINKSY